MSYLKLYSLCPDDKVVAAWESQVAKAKETPWLAEALARRGSELFPRFATRYAELKALPRGARRALQRRLTRSRELAEIVPEWLHGRARRSLQHKLARSLAGAALLLALGGGVAEAATIVVNTTSPGFSADGKCSLNEAIINANDDAATFPDCAAGSGADTIKLPKKSTITLTAACCGSYGPRGLVAILTDITIEGNESKIVRGVGAPEFGIMAVSSTGDLTLRRLRVSGGALTDYYGGGIYVDASGALTIERSTISGNTVTGSPNASGPSEAYGGGIFAGTGSTVTITNSTISGNTAMSGAAGDDSQGYGGGLFAGSLSTVTITNSTISGNKAVSGATYDEDSEASGGGLFASSSTVTITNSTISGNTAASGQALNGYQSQAYGGGIYASGSSTLTILNSTISGNTALAGQADGDSEAYGGGVYASGGNTVTITNSTISGNVAMAGPSAEDSQAFGGGIKNSGTMTIENSTISGNTAVGGSAVDNSQAYGGGINGGGSMTITNSTISGNTAVSGPAGGNSYARGGGISGGGLGLGRSLISGNVAATTGREVHNFGGITVDYYNIFGFSGDAGLFGVAAGASDIVPTVPVSSIIGVLRSNGGRTKTHFLPGGSPAINASPIAGCPATDQRGVARPKGAGCDIGSFEK